MDFLPEKDSFSKYLQYAFYMITLCTSSKMGVLVIASLCMDSSLNGILNVSSDLEQRF